MADTLQKSSEDQGLTTAEQQAYWAMDADAALKSLQEFYPNITKANVNEVFHNDKQPYDSKTLLTYNITRTIDQKFTEKQRVICTIVAIRLGANIFQLDGDGYSPIDLINKQTVSNPQVKKIIDQAKIDEVRRRASILGKEMQELYLMWQVEQEGKQENPLRVALYKYKQKHPSGTLGFDPSDTLGFDTAVLIPPPTRKAYSVPMDSKGMGIGLPGQEKEIELGSLPPLLPVSGHKHLGQATAPTPVVLPVVPSVPVAVVDAAASTPVVPVEPFVPVAVVAASALPVAPVTAVIEPTARELESRALALQQKQLVMETQRSLVEKMRAARAAKAQQLAAAPSASAVPPTKLVVKTAP